MDSTALYENDSEDIVEPAHKRLRSSSYNDEQSSLHLLRTATTLTDYSSDDDADDQDRESVHSWQGYETDWVGDSGDEWCPSDNFQDKDEDSLTEFELADESDDESDQFSDCSSSSQLSDVLLAHDLIPDYQTSNASSLDESDSWDSDAVSIDSQATEKAWECLKCGTNVIMPMKFCFACNQKRKSDLPPRPIKPTRTKKKASAAAIPSTCTASSSSSSTYVSDEATTGPPATSPDNSCSICQGPRDGAFLHGNSAHVVYCYSCTKRLSHKSHKRRRPKCPICRRTIEKALKLFFS